MRKILKVLLLLLPVLASASSLSGTPPYTAISNTTYVMGGGGGFPSGSGMIVSDSVGNLFFSDQYGHNFSAATASGCSAGADFITPQKMGSTITGVTLWYKNTNNCLPIQVTTSYVTGTGVTLTAATSTNAPSMVSGILNQVVGVPEISSSYPNSGGIVLSKGTRTGTSSLNYYQLNGINNYTFSFFQHLAKSHIDANTSLLASAGPLNLDVRDLATGNSNSYMLPKICQKRPILSSGSVKFMYAGISDIYLICNKDGDSPKKAMLFRYSNAQGSFDAGQKFNPNDTLVVGDEDYKAASSKHGMTSQEGIVFLEQSGSTGKISYLNTCQDSNALGNCQPQTVSGITNVGSITGGVITHRFSASGRYLGYAALFVGNSNMIFKVDLDGSGNYTGYSTY